MMLLAVAGAYAMAVYVARLVERMLTHRWDADRALASARHRTAGRLASRDVAVRERTIALEERKFDRNAVSPAEPQAMPPALVDRILMWEDDWAQDNQRAEIMALYAEYRDWEKVIARLPAVGPIGQ